MSEHKTERRVYNLPNDLVRRIETFRDERGLPSETEAARLLLTMAFHAQDTVATLEAQMAAAFDRLGNLRLAAVEVLVTHPRVKQVDFSEITVSFTMTDDTSGYFTARKTGA